jgi:outer membrane receptor for ferrienterochelin and colicins
VPRFDYTHTTPSLFVQDEVSPAGWMTIAASGRLDAHSEYGTFFNPAAVRAPAPRRRVEREGLRSGPATSRPTPFTEETEGFGLTPLDPLGPLKAERARSASLDVGRTWGHVELNATLFGSEVREIR